MGQPPGTADSCFRGTRWHTWKKDAFYRLVDDFFQEGLRHENLASDQAFCGSGAAVSDGTLTLEEADAGDRGCNF